MLTVFLLLLLYCFFKVVTGEGGRKVWRWIYTNVFYYYYYYYYKSIILYENKTKEKKKTEELLMMNKRLNE